MCEQGKGSEEKREREMREGVRNRREERTDLMNREEYEDSDQHFFWPL